MITNKKNKKVAIVMGSQSDYIIMKKCEEILKILKIKYETKIISAHRTPDRMFEFAKTAAKNNFAVIVAGAGGAAHLPGMETKQLKGLDSLLSIVQMPKGVPVATVAIGENGAFNAGLLATSIIALSEIKIKKNLEKWRRLQTAVIKKKPN
jgi:5-(carboxyamino)imidazole ribonucleotide mutase